MQAHHSCLIASSSIRLLGCQRPSYRPFCRSTSCCPSSSRAQIRKDETRSTSLWPRRASRRGARGGIGRHMHRRGDRTTIRRWRASISSGSCNSQLTRAMGRARPVASGVWAKRQRAEKKQISGQAERCRVPSLVHRRSSIVVGVR